MTEEFKVTLPKLGESILSATVVQWFKKPGDQIQLDEPLLEVSTDKVNSEIPSPVAGVIKEILARAEEELNVGEPLAIIQVGRVEGSPAPSKEAVVNRSAAKEEAEGERSSFFSPALIRLARERGVELSELQKITGTGGGGRVTKKDLEIYCETRSASAPCPLKRAAAPSGQVERLKMTGMRKAIADNMVRSFYQAPHATLVHEVDVTGALKAIHREKESFLARYGAKLTITSFVARALCRALQEYPLINASLEEDTIVLKHFVNLGIAVSVDQGIMVPVIKHCHQMPLSEIAKSLGQLTAKTRSGGLTAEDVRDGTISLTNFGMSGVAIGIPIIRYPEVAIIGIGAIQKRVVATPDEAIAVRSMMHLSLTFDHRVLDGMYGCGFLAALKGHLEEDFSL